MRASNFISLTGNLGADVEQRESKPGTEIARLSVAETVSRPNPKTGAFEQVHTNWSPVTAFGSLAKRAVKSLKKGDRVTVLGTLKSSSYEKDGENRRGFEVIAYSIEKAGLLGRADTLDPAAGAGFPPFDQYRDESVAAGTAGIN